MKIVFQTKSNVNKIGELDLFNHLYFYLYFDIINGFCSWFLYKFFFPVTDSIKTGEFLAILGPR